MKVRNNTIKDYNIESILSVNGSLSGFECFSFDYFAEDIEHLKTPHRHNFYAVIFTSSGNSRHSIDFSEYEILPRRVFLINYGQLHHWDHLKRVKGYVILFTTDFYNLIYTGNEKIKSDQALQGNQVYVDLDMQEFHDWDMLLQLIAYEHLHSGSNSNEIICLFLKTLILKYNRKSNNAVSNSSLNSRKLNLINDYKLYIEQYYKEWKLPKLYAQLMNISPNYLNSICQQTVGKSASELIKDRVMLEAKRLLTHTDETIIQIAFQLGFDDNSYFTKYFKQYEKTTPDSFRLRKRNF